MCVVHTFPLHRNSCSILLLLPPPPSLLPRRAIPRSLAEWLNEGFGIRFLFLKKTLVDVAWKSTQFSPAVNQRVTWLTTNSHQPIYEHRFLKFTHTLSEIEKQKMQYLFNSVKCVTNSAVDWLQEIFSCEMWNGVRRRIGVIFLSNELVF